MNKFVSDFVFAILLSSTIFATSCAFSNLQSQAPNAQSNIKSNAAQQAQTSKTYAKPQRIATLQDEAVSESSGLAVSTKNAGAFWTHNDSGGGAFLFAFDCAGKKLGTWQVSNAKNVDWEDLAIYKNPNDGESYLLIADIGNNERTRGDAIIYRVVEPKITTGDNVSTKKNPRQTQPAEAIKIEYPDQRRDAEVLLVNPANGDLYIVSKSLIGEADVYKLSAPFKTAEKQTLKRIGQTGVPSITPGFLTGGAVSPDGKRLVLTDYFAAYESTLPANSKNFDDIWKIKPDRIDLGERAQGEAVAYAPDNKSIFATSEKRPTPLIEVKRK